MDQINRKFSSTYFSFGLVSRASLDSAQPAFHRTYCTGQRNAAAAAKNPHNFCMSALGFSDILSDQKNLNSIFDELEPRGMGKNPFVVVIAVSCFDRHQNCHVFFPQN